MRSGTHDSRYSDSSFVSSCTVQNSLVIYCDTDIFRYTLNPTFTPYTDLQKQAIQAQVQGSGQAVQGSNLNTITLKLFLRSLEYQHIYNFPENGVQFIGEIGGLMSFFLGMSVISFVECLCFCCCCGCRENPDDSEEKNRPG